jgi:hypothetical protein
MSRKHFQTAILHPHAVWVMIAIPDFDNQGWPAIRLSRHSDIYPWHQCSVLTKLSLLTGSSRRTARSSRRSQIRLLFFIAREEASPPKGHPLSDSIMLTKLTSPLARSRNLFRDADASRASWASAQCFGRIPDAALNRSLSARHGDVGRLCRRHINCGCDAGPMTIPAGTIGIVGRLTLGITRGGSSILERPIGTLETIGKEEPGRVRWLWRLTPPFSSRSFFAFSSAFVGRAMLVCS